MQESRSDPKRRRRRLALWVPWIPLVWIISFPWIGYTPDPQWDRVYLIPFVDPGDKLPDMLANTLLFVPFGYSLARGGRGTRSFLRVAAITALVSTSAEAMQLFSTERYPSATDLSAATLGALAGAFSTLGRHFPSKPGT